MILHNMRPSSTHNKTLLTYKDIDLLRKFINGQGKILPRRLTKLSSKQQKQMARAIKQARILALLPFINDN
uniref:Ribosomal protein S18 n=1 Tax=Hildenbrandia rubra TaxID=31481 RepID=A0A1C9CFW1_9FLOR|nr:ribosomal protein S18 [Hildenbrandia rubra]AOM67278.1 ribosomal protein S18 [Hildenbrandia rubra]